MNTKHKGLADWAESLLCNAQPEAHCKPEEWQRVVGKWRDAKHALYPDGPTVQPKPSNRWWACDWAGPALIIAGGLVVDGGMPVTGWFTIMVGMVLGIGRVGEWLSKH